MQVQYVKRFSKILYEDIEAVKKNYPKITDDKFMQLIALDPTYKEGRDSVGKYGKWILNLYNKGNLKEEDFYKVTDYLNEFEEKKKGFANKDIGQFKSLPDLAKALDGVEVELTHGQQVRQNQKARKNTDLDKDASLVYKDNTYEIWVPHTYAASCKLGQGSHWCTASTESDQYYNTYLKNYGGEYYILLDAKSKEPLFQFHFESNQFMDKYDKSIDLMKFFEQYPPVRKFFEPKIKKMCNIPEDVSLDEPMEITMNMEDIWEGFDNYGVIGKDVLDSDQLKTILSDEGPFDWFVDIGDYYGWDDFTAYPPTLSEENEQTLQNLGFDIADYPECLKDTSYEDAFAYACSDAMAITAVNDCIEDTVSWLRDNGVTLSWDEDGNRVAKTTATPISIINKVVEDELSDVYDDLSTMAGKVIGEKLAENPMYGPGYDWGGYIDDSVFNEYFADRLAELSEN